MKYFLNKIAQLNYEKAFLIADPNATNFI
ncbi:hypothetical protein [Galbibacter pacificus]